MRRLFSLLWRWLDALQRTLANLLLLALIVVAGLVLFSMNPTIPEQAVLDLRIHGTLSEQIAPPSLATFPLSLPEADQSSIPDIVKALKRAAADPRIKALWLDLSDMAAAPLARIATITDAIDQFRASGKPVIAYGDSFSTAQYLIATAADTIVLHPTGLVALTGPAAERHYFKSALDRLSIRAQLVRAGKYKSFAEPMTLDAMSEEARTATRAWIDQWWRQIKTRLTERRGIDSDRLQRLLDHPEEITALAHGDLATFEQREKLVDTVGDLHDAKSLLQQRLQRDEPLPRIALTDYLAAIPDDTEHRHDPAIAIIRASGEIVPGEQPASVIGDRTLNALIQRATDDDEIAAVVLRIDSPGGSATASESIHRALIRLKKAGKPLVVSMGGIAASGGYWIATAADEIWARPATLTGSIGVFAIIPDLSPALDRAGIHLDGVKTTALTPIRSDRPLDPAQQALLQSGVEFIYDTFLQRVAEGRHMPQDQVAKIAQGRVWSGRDALRLHLVDHLGGLDDAVAAAARRIGASKGNYQTRELTADEGPWKLLMMRLSTLAQIQVPTVLAPLLRQMRSLSHLHDPRGIYAYAEF